MSYKFKVGDIVTVHKDYDKVESYYENNKTLNTWRTLEYSIGKKLVIREIHESYPMLYEICSMWYHENWLEYYDEKFELEEELFLI